MKITCEALKTYLPDEYRGLVFASGRKTILNLSQVPDEIAEQILQLLESEDIRGYQSDPVHLGGYYEMEKVYNIGKPYIYDFYGEN